MDIIFRFRPVWEPSVFGTASFLGLQLIQALSVTFGSSIVYKIMPERRKVLQKYPKSTPNPKSTSRVLQKYSKSTPKLPKKYFKSTPKVLQKFSKSTPKVPQKYSKSTPKCPKSTPEVFQKYLLEYSIDS